MDLTSLITQHKNKILNIVVIIVALFIVNNIYKGQQANTLRLKEKRDVEIKKSEVLKEVSQLDKKFKALKGAVNKKNIASVINTLNNLARDSSLKIISLRPQGQKEFPAYIKYTYNLAVAAPDYHSIGKFIGRLESSEDIYLVEGIKISSETQAQSEADRRRAEITVSTILIKD